jgi:hypothetical protein
MLAAMEGIFLVLPRWLPSPLAQVILDIGGQTAVSAYDPPFPLSIAIALRLGLPWVLALLALALAARCLRRSEAGRRAWTPRFLRRRLREPRDYQPFEGALEGHIEHFLLRASGGAGSSRGMAVAAFALGAFPGSVLFGLGWSGILSLACASNIQWVHALRGEGVLDDLVVTPLSSAELKAGVLRCIERRLRAFMPALAAASLVPIGLLFLPYMLAKDVPLALVVVIAVSMQVARNQASYAGSCALRAVWSEGSERRQVAALTIALVVCHGFVFVGGAGAIPSAIRFPGSGEIGLVVLAILVGLVMAGAYRVLDLDARKTWDHEWNFRERLAKIESGRM